MCISNLIEFFFTQEEEISVQRKVPVPFGQSSTSSSATAESKRGRDISAVVTTFNFCGVGDGKRIQNRN